MANAEKIAEFDFSKADTLIIGGTRGFGRALAIDLKRRGVENLALGTSSLQSDHFSNTLAAMRSEGINTQGVIPFVAEVTDQKQVEDAIEELPFNPNHIFYLVAGGMNLWGLKLYQRIVSLQAIKNYPQRHDQGAEDKVLTELHQDYDVWLPTYLEDAVKVNLLAPVKTLEALVGIFKDGFTYTYLDSLFGDEGKGPRYYTNVLLKHQFGIWLSQNAASYARRGVDTSRIKAAAILGTDVGDFITEEIALVEDKEVAEKLIDTAVNAEDIFEPMYQFMAMSSQEKTEDGLPFERYVYRHDGEVYVTRDFPSELRIDQRKYLL